MDLTKLSKSELLNKCNELGISKCKSKNKTELIELINKNLKDDKTLEDTEFEETVDEDTSVSKPLEKKVESISKEELMKNVENMSIEEVINDKLRKKRHQKRTY